MSRSAAAMKRRSQTQKDLRRIYRAYDNLLFAQELPVRVGELRSAIRQNIIAAGGKITLKTLNQYPKAWHPKHRESSQTFRSYGGIIVTGFYPSDEDPKKGIILIPEQGFFPAELGPYFSNQLKTKKKLENQNQKYSCWLRGTNEEPYYNFVLERPGWTESSVIRKPFHFRIQGLIIKREKDKIWVRIIENVEEPLITFLVTIEGFNLKIDKGKQFWIMDCDFEDKKLVFRRGVRVD